MGVGVALPTNPKKAFPGKSKKNDADHPSNGLTSETNAFSITTDGP